MQHSPIAANFDVDKEYRAIETALLETARGRWFLAEHGRRARRLDAVMLEEAIGRLQTAIRQPPALLGQLKYEVEELTEFVRETRQELTSRSAGAAVPFGAHADSGGERTTVGAIIEAAETMHEAAWALQSRELDPAACEAIARNAAIVYALSRQQAVESQRAVSISEALDRAIARLAAMRDTIMHELEVDQGGEAPTPPVVLESHPVEAEAPLASWDDDAGEGEMAPRDPPFHRPRADI